MNNIRNKDLNLLAVFVAISEELNLSRAAIRLNLSQPALSHALSRLREQFGNPLFVRSQRGLVATPKVSVLLPQVRAVLELANRVYSPEQTLSLAQLNRKVVIASTDYFEAHAVTRFVKLAQTQAPGLQIETRTLSGGFPKRELESGEYDVAIAAYFDELPNSFRIRTVFKDRFACICSKTNSYLKTKRTLGDYLNTRHLQIEVPPGVFAPADQYLSGKKKRRKIALRLGNFLSPPAVLHQTEYLLTCPLSLANRYAEMYPLTVTELPFELAGLETKMVWHEKDQTDPFHSWLRNSLANSG